MNDYCHVHFYFRLSSFYSYIERHSINQKWKWVLLHFRRQKQGVTFTLYTDLFASRFDCTTMTRFCKRIQVWIQDDYCYGRFECPHVLCMVINMHFWHVCKAVAKRRCYISHVRPSVRKKRAATTEQILVKFRICGFYKNPSIPSDLA